MIVKFSGTDENIDISFSLDEPPVYDDNISEILNFNTPSPKIIEYPKMIKVVLKKNIDIIKIHDSIRRLFSYKRFMVKEYKSRIIFLKKILEKKNLTLVESTKILETIKELEEEIKKYDSGKHWESYSSRAKPLLEKYVKLISKVVFGEKDSDNSNVLDLIEKYITVASDYVEFDVIREFDKKILCEGCGKQSSDDTECECGYKALSYVNEIVYKDIDRLNSSGKTEYDDRSNFIKALDQFSGKTHIAIPSKLYKDLDNYFTSIGFYTGEEVKKRFKLLDNGKRENTSIQILIQALSATKNSQYYGCVNHIAMNYWGWKPPDISDIRQQIIKDYEETQKVYEEIKERGSSLNVQLRLYLHLKARDYPCELTDFKTISSRESLEYHDRMWKIMCERTGLKYTPLI
ncbi:MAG: hypothetical protein KatS3mg101_0916 [Patescibacteria group bacterium]|nr:MAG: hypothetical protein KatS3mg101_0916 [Patescibacteria group bacterium]